MKRIFVNMKKEGRLHEIMVCVLLWSFVFIFPIINESYNFVHGQSFMWRDVFSWWLGTLPYLLLFVINYTCVVLFLLKRGKVKVYVLCAILLLSVFTCYISYDFKYNKFPHHQKPHPFESIEDRISEQSIPDVSHDNHRPPYYFLVIPPPIMMRFILALLVLGMNIAIALIYDSQRKQNDMKSMENIRLQGELKYLKTQIRPHFFMNMLNNIHSMVEVNAEEAQRMILELSKLMRYVLYEGEKSLTSFNDEVIFISSYVTLMRRRYSSEKVIVNLDIPDHPSDKIMLPPLLFISFVENAFKHGISYLRQSKIDIRIEQQVENIYFECVNTKPQKIKRDIEKGGVGLENIKRRLDLLFADKYDLQIEDKKDSYSVILRIPV